MKKSSPASGKWKHRDLEVLGMGILPQHNDNVMACPLRGESCSFCETHHLRDALVGRTETQLHKDPHLRSACTCLKGFLELWEPEKHAACTHDVSTFTKLHYLFCSSTEQYADIVIII